MKKLGIIFLIAVLGPSLVLAWLATRSLRHQDYVVQLQRAQIHQDTTDQLAGDVRAFMDDVRIYYQQLVDEMVVEYGEPRLREDFDDLIRDRWSQARVGCVVTDLGLICSPPMTSTEPRIREFFGDNGALLTNTSAAAWYQAPPVINNRLNVEVVTGAESETSSDRDGERKDKDDDSERPLFRWSSRDRTEKEAEESLKRGMDQAGTESFSRKVPGFTAQSEETGEPLAATASTPESAPPPTAPPAAAPAPSSSTAQRETATKPVATEPAAAAPASTPEPAAKEWAGKSSVSQSKVSVFEGKLRSRQDPRNSNIVIGGNIQAPDPADTPANGGAITLDEKQLAEAREQVGQAGQMTAPEGAAADPFAPSPPPSEAPFGGPVQEQPQLKAQSPQQERQAAIADSLRDENDPSLQADFAPVYRQVNPQVQPQALQWQGTQSLNFGLDGVAPNAPASETWGYGTNGIGIDDGIGKNNGFGNGRAQQLLSSLTVNSGELRELMGDEPAGAVSRFIDDELSLLLWYRHVDIPSLVFWVEIDLDEIQTELAQIITGYQPGAKPEVCVALLNAAGLPVALNVSDFQPRQWTRPFTASEIGEILPHWEVAAYLLNPGLIRESARSAKFAVWLMVVVLVTAIGLGSMLIFRDVGREMRLARQKTDFVSNVSHELKTPLTSIRMFSELLGGNGGLAENKRAEYAGIISTEAGRLSRLINNLLDFSRMERGDKRYDFRDVNLDDLLTECLDHFKPQLDPAHMRLYREGHDDDGDGDDDADTAWWVRGDRDGLSQVLLNLLSNAEKYGAAGGEIVVRQIRDPKAGTVEVQVLDRGPGVSRAHEAKVFEKFYRVDDSLSSGIQGSGLGLTLARQIARAHGGDVSYCHRDGGGSCFKLTLPTTGKS